MKLSDFDFELPEELIAQNPSEQRGQSRLLLVNPPFQDLAFSQITQVLKPGDLLVLNDTRVVKARLHGRRASGGQVEVMVERVTGADSFCAMVKASNAPKAGTRIHLPGGTTIEMTGREGILFSFKVVQSKLSLDDLMEQFGQLPLPPYITHTAGAEDEERYQTVFAKRPGAVAAPTAGLHFTDELLAKIRQQGVGVETLTLHVGAGTFLPVKTEDVSQHKMHRERYEIAPDVVERMILTKERGGRIVSVGTTSLRALEAFCTETGVDFNSRDGLHTAARYTDAGHRGDTDIFITPGYKFKAVDCLQTNFHLPKSTLLMLVSAFAGKDLIMKAYQHAISNQYRFFSYGDAMWLERQG